MKYKKEKMNKLSLMIGVFLAAIVLAQAVSAFGVASPGVTLQMYPGEERIVNLNVQNRAGATEDVIARMEITQNPDNIATLKKGEYLVKAGDAVDAAVLIKIPANATIGTSYKVVVDTKSITTGTNTGGIAMGIGMASPIPIEVVSKTVAPTPVPTKEFKLNYKFLSLIAIIIIIVIAVIIVLMKVKGKKKHKR